MVFTRGEARVIRTTRREHVTYIMASIVLKDGGVSTSRILHLSCFTTLKAKADKLQQGDVVAFSGSVTEMDIYKGSAQARIILKTLRRQVA